MKRGKWTGGWRLNVVLTAGIMVTVLMALIMAQLDALQAQQPHHNRLVIANIQATAVANGSPISLPFAGSLGAPPPGSDPNAIIIPDVNPRRDQTGGDGAPNFPVCGEVPAGWLLYSVEAGDTVALLATATQSDPAAILAANCLAVDALTAGMQVLLPGQPIAALQCGPPQWWVRYQVRAGDTIGALAAARGTTVAEVLRANCRDSEALSAGQMIFLPPGGQTSPPIVAPPIVPPPPGQPPVIPTALPMPEVTATQPSAPPVVPTTGPLPPTAVPTVPPVPTRVVPTATAPAGVTATPPGVPTTPPTHVPPTATSPALTATTVPTRVPPTPTVPPLPTSTPLPPPTDTPVPPPTDTPLPPPTDTPVPPPTDTPVPPPTNTPEPEPTTTPEPEPAPTWYRPFVWQWYWR